MPLTDFTTNILPFYASNVANDPNYEAPGNFGLPVYDLGANSLISATLGASGGSSYALSATFNVTVAGGTAIIPAVISVTSNSSGVVTTVNSIINPGEYTVLPTLTNNVVTGGAGSGLEITLVFNSAQAAAQKLLTMIEVIRSLIAETTSPNQLRDIHEVLRKMMMTMKFGSASTFSAANYATRAQAAALNYVAKNPTHSQQPLIQGYGVGFVEPPEDLV